MARWLGFKGYAFVNWSSDVESAIFLAPFCCVSFLCGYFIGSSVVCLLICSASVLASPGSVVFNSFKDRSLALKESALISRQFGIEARIEEARVNGQIYHRVLGPVMDQSSAPRTHSSGEGKWVS